MENMIQMFASCKNHKQASNALRLVQARKAGTNSIMADTMILQLVGAHDRNDLLFLMDHVDEIPDLVDITEPSVPKVAPLIDGIKVPLTIITGFLGSGKTTLLEHLLNDPLQTKNLAVILNDFSETSSIDKTRIMRKSDSTGVNNVEEWLTMPNGCLCCSLKDIGLLQIEALIKTSIESGRKIDHLLLEANGLAKPDELVRMFWCVEGGCVQLDGIVCVVDSTSKWLAGSETHQEEYEIFTRQVAMADRLLINKTDLLESDNHLRDVTDSLRALNKSAVIKECHRSQVPLDFILNIQAYNLHSNISKVNAFLQESESHGSSRREIAAIRIQFNEKVSSIDAFERWLESILWENVLPSSTMKTEVIRMKGFLQSKDSNNVYLYQGVYEMYDKELMALNEFYDINDLKEVKVSLAFIGRNLDQTAFIESFRKHCL